ncbi:hypothetical protein [Hymenobacter wooponensis]|uniref:STAS/SEC14 domain-containing protein n=1 Tax=Hymenobacter wooponensis TaxID=1525360 RepID=A0A4Z0MK12_9BACT|nr:hypothetical protein [Hymenobacter wooponensis]TGD79690.1 hypothetical protein EU557_15850 [Hymenobacter wooponensis]
MPFLASSLYFENAVGKLYEQADSYAFVQYKSGKRAFPDLQAFLTHLAQLLRRRGWYKMLTDQRQMSQFTQEERLWIRDTWLTGPQAVSHELLAAVLLPEDVFARLSMKLVMNETREGILVYHIFGDEQEAAAWLRRI